MKNKNEVIYTIREVLGDEEPSGFYLNIENVKVPNYLFKDGKSEYPEIRISPFITGEKKISFDYAISQRWRNIKNIFKADFQIDIYSKSIPQINKICRAIENRISDFTDIDTIIYDYTPDYINNGNYYKNDIYENKNFMIGWICVENIMLTPACDIDKLIDNSWYLGDDGLYVKTDLDIKTIQVMCIYNGRLLSNGESLYGRGIYNIKTTNFQELSELEDNEVERIMIEFSIVYGLERQRKHGPVSQNINIGAKDD